MKKIKYILLYLLLISFSNLNADILKSIVIKPNNRLNCYFDTKINTYDSKLSDDKKSVVIEIPNINIEENTKRIVGTKIIEDVYTQKNDNLVRIKVFLDDEYGYTATFLPFSRNLMLEVFKWNEISKAEDHYRTALLALEDNIYPTAIEELIKASKLKHPEAISILGILLQKAEKYDLAKDFYILADSLNSDIQDIYAGLYLITNKEDSISANIHLSNFKSKSGIINIDTLEKNSTIKELINYEDFLFAEKILNDIKDERKTNKKTDSVLTKNFENLFPDKDSTNTEKTTSDFLGSYIEYFIMIIAAIVLLVVYRYLKWRNNKIQELQKADKEKQKKSKNEFNQELKKSKNKIKANSKLIADKYRNEQLKQKNKPEKKETDTKSNQEKLNKIIEDKLKDKVVDEAEKKVSTKKTSNPKVELAMHLAKEQQNIKNKNIETIRNLPADADKLSEVAKKFGIEKGSLEVKKAIDDLENDPEELTKLTEKFSQFRK